MCRVEAQEGLVLGEDGPGSVMGTVPVGMSRILFCICVSFDHCLPGWVGEK